MKWIFATSPKTKHIIPIQKRLFYEFEWPMDSLHYVSNDGHISEWCKSIKDYLETIKDEFIVFGLDDFLPIEYFDQKKFDKALRLVEMYDRVELGWCSGWNEYKIEGNDHLMLIQAHPYTVSTQFSLWKTKNLIKVLEDVNSDPWKFETKGKCFAAALKEPALEYINESALSKRQPGKINLLGLRESVISKLVSENLVNRKDIIFGWEGSKRVDQKLAGKKYWKFYE